MIIKCKINVTKIDKAKLFKGKSGIYLDITLLENRDGTDQYGNNFMILQDTTKEEREAGVRGVILGNAKIIGGSKSKSSAPEPAPAGDAPLDLDEPPF